MLYENEKIEPSHSNSPRIQRLDLRIIVQQALLESFMTYQFLPNKMYRMPTHFGPSLGPRQGPDGRKFDCKNVPKNEEYRVSFLTNGEQLEAMLPEGFELVAEPVVTIELTYVKEIQWLAGRGYNVLGVSFPVRFVGKRDKVTGQFLTVLWENFADPIFTGREELGFSKIYCDLPDPRVYEGQTHCIASWQGYKFMDMTINNLIQLSPDELKASQAGPVDDGILHYKYIPRTGDWCNADVSYAILTPFCTPNRVVKEKWQGEGTVKFHKAKWEDLPTTYHIVNAFADLEIKEYKSATITKAVGAKDLSDQRILQ
jgi:hypothetical protein